MRMRKGQTAMEYLMTYGWAILIIMVVLAVLFYLGILNPGRLTPSQCTFSAGISCTTYKLKTTSSNLTLQIGQGIGKTMKVQGVYCGSNQTSSYSPPMINYSISPNENVTITSGASAYIAGDDKTGDTGKSIAVTCRDPNGAVPTTTSVDSLYIGKIYINYTEVETGMTRIAVGTLTTKYEA
jgi:hypothetical protein